MIAKVRRRAISAEADMAKASTQQGRSPEGKLYFARANPGRITDNAHSSPSNAQQELASSEIVGPRYPP
jgi:hypothetical protein